MNCNTASCIALSFLASSAIFLKDVSWSINVFVWMGQSARVLVQPFPGSSPDDPPFRRGEGPGDEVAFLQAIDVFKFDAQFIKFETEWKGKHNLQTCYCTRASQTAQKQGCLVPYRSVAVRLFSNGLQMTSTWVKITKKVAHEEIPACIINVLMSLMCVTTALFSQRRCRKQEEDVCHWCPLGLVILKSVWNSVGDTFYLRCCWPWAVVSCTFLAQSFALKRTGTFASERKVMCLF